MQDNDLLPISGLAHLLYCERRLYLIHAEGLWAESGETAEGAWLHRKAHNAERDDSHDGVLVRRGLPLCSKQLGLTGMADVVELHPDPEGATIPGVRARYRPFPVEYKRGRLRREAGYLVQLCAQGLCIEEMLMTLVPAGALFFGKTRRRMDVAFDRELRQKTIEAVSRMRELLNGSAAPLAEPGPRCSKCSLLNLCMPEAVSGRRSAERHLAKVLARLKNEVT